jgi:hypothetical protein
VIYQRLDVELLDEPEIKSIFACNCVGFGEDDGVKILNNIERTLAQIFGNNMSLTKADLTSVLSKVKNFIKCYCIHMDDYAYMWCCLPVLSM